MGQHAHGPRYGGPWTDGRLTDLRGFGGGPGACPNVSASFPPANAGLDGEGAKRFRVALVGHSAGGWVSRIYLSEARYNGVSEQQHAGAWQGVAGRDMRVVGRCVGHGWPVCMQMVYNGSRLVDTLVTLGSPHVGHKPRTRNLTVNTSHMAFFSIIGGWRSW